VTPPLKDTHEFVTLSPAQARRFLKAVKGDRLEALYIVALMTGMREGEPLGLRWADVDLDGGALHITRRLKRRTSRRQVLFVVPRPINPSNFLQRNFYLLLEEADLPRMRFHDLRHSAATLLLSMGCIRRSSVRCSATRRSESRSTCTRT
jgi:integrase